MMQVHLRAHFRLQHLCGCLELNLLVILSYGAYEWPIDALKRCQIGNTLRHGRILLLVDATRLSRLEQLHFGMGGCTLDLARRDRHRGVLDEGARCF